MRRPQHIYITTVFITFFALYFACSFIVPAPFARDCLFGASQFLPWGILPYLAVLLPMLPVSLAAETIHTWSTHGSLSPLCDVSPQKLPHVILFTVASSLCFFLRNNTLNADALLFAGNFARDIPTLGAHLTHDEILELYVHSRFWAITHAWFDWDVTLSYQVLSALAGGVFFCVLLQHCKVLAGDQAATLFCLVASGGFIQLFFGDVENYTLTAVLLLSYFFWSALHLQGSCGPLAPSICLGVAMMFHLLSGFLLPSLAYLLYRDWRRGNRTRAATATIAVIVIPVATLTWFHLNGLPIQRLFYNSHAFGQGGNIGKVLVRPSFEYYAAILDKATPLL